MLKNGSGMTTGSKERKRQYAAPALDKAFMIIELLANEPRGLLASEIAAALGRSLGELFRIIVVMEDAGYLQKSAIDDRYSVTYKFLDIAYRATPARGLVQAAQPEMQRLALATGQSCHLVVPKTGEGLVIAREENPGVRGFALRVGASIELTRSCSGGIILAFSAPSVAERMLDRAESMAPAPIGRAALFTRLEEIRRDGFYTRPSPITRGVTDIGCPVMGFDGEFLAALTIPYLELIDGSQLVSIEEARAILLEAAKEISRQLGYYRPDSAATAT
ncbi:IclR family transcriptional regulator [Sphingomonas panacis]|uniref:IclR family transcriptional regulator n=1 Tax=Sphingomonas panacis TaxID=1560345 RepID=A0A1B3Z7B8_9SPHN|nr:IclR family transcriptional regulator [Sphingomonas panacis]AOH83322.1 IclR family transcriptional regulator [Sphingomonas panacis]